MSLWASMDADKNAFYEMAAKGHAASTILYGVDSAVHVEEKDDIWFWQQLLPKYRPKRYKFMRATTNALLLPNYKTLLKNIRTYDNNGFV